MRRTIATDCRTLGFEVAEVFTVLLDLDNYPRWWPAHLRVRVIPPASAAANRRIEVRPLGGRFFCEIDSVDPNREIVIHYIEGVHRGEGKWTFEQTPGGTRVCYRIDLEPQGWLPRLLSNFMNFGTMHSRSMEELFDRLEGWLQARSQREPHR